MKDFLIRHGVELFSVIPLSKCKVIKEYLLTKNGFDLNANVIMMLFPYRSEKVPKNLSVYASVKDYHAFVNTLAAESEDYIRKKHPNALFKMFADHSPIDEVHAACVSGLGFIGDNGLLISPQYSSFVFLGECVTNLTPEELGIDYAKNEGVTTCLHCGKCAEACPCGCIKRVGDVDEFNPKSMCLSAVTQKKGELDCNEIQLMLDNNTVWGCDACQNACPYTKKAEFTPIDFFKTDVIDYLDKKTLDSLSEEEFKERPFSWRGRDIIERNVIAYEKSKGGKI